MDGGTQRTLAVSQPGLSRPATIAIVASFLTLAAGLVIVGYVLSAASKERTAELEQRIAKTEVRLEGVAAALAESESRLRRAESVVAADESEAAARNAERQQLASSPSKYIQSLDVTISRKGIINTYSHASFARLQNTS